MCEYVNTVAKISCMRDLPQQATFSCQRPRRQFCTECEVLVCTKQKPSNDDSNSFWQTPPQVHRYILRDVLHHCHPNSMRTNSHHHRYICSIMQGRKMFVCCTAWIVSKHRTHQWLDDFTWAAVAERILEPSLSSPAWSRISCSGCSHVW